ncbi:MAG: LPXTG cell wall anchor domain-containing protein [Coriobacteriales bacterium]|jgi:LPXTG-motif cell wall-anchored protein|nr:LPXTG cell wall anchor domain-containing protein [Coriobacteriales bacterium]
MKIKTPKKTAACVACAALLSLSMASFVGFGLLQGRHKAAFADETVYTITAHADGIGQINPAGTVRVHAGETQCFSMDATKGYQINTVTVDGKVMTVPYPTQYFYYYFNNVSADHTISVSCTPTQAGSGGSTPSGGGSGSGGTTPSGGGTVAGGGSASGSTTGNSASASSTDSGSNTSKSTKGSVPQTGDQDAWILALAGMVAVLGAGLVAASLLGERRRRSLSATKHIK